MLTLLDRLVFPTIFPNEGSFENVILKKDIIEKLKITQDELKLYEIHEVEKSIVWNKEGAEATFEYEFTDMEKTYIATCLKKLSEQEKITNELIEIYRTFVIK